MTTTTTPTPIKPERILRIPAILERLPVSYAHWKHGVKIGKYPAPIQLTARTVGWRESDIDALILSLSQKAAE
jgi:prophage regulatory protein